MASAKGGSERPEWVMASAASALAKTISTSARRDGLNVSLRDETGRSLRAAAIGDQTRRSSNVPLVPPKPNEFDSAASIFIGRAVLAQ